MSDCFSPRDASLSPSSGGLDQAALRRAFAQFATGVTVVTAVDGDEPRGMTANAFMSVSLEPPLIAVSVKLTARFHAVLSASPQFGVSVLPAGLEAEARHFAGLPVASDGPEPQLDWSSGLPLLPGAVAWFAADMVDRHQTGDHSLFIGRVRAFGALSDDTAPLVFHRSRFGRLIEEPDPLPTDPWGWTVDRWG